MASPTPLITIQDLRDRFGASSLDRAFDENSDGQADTSMLERLRKDASSKVVGGLPDYDPDDLNAENAALTNELKRIALDIAFAMGVQRYPEVFHRDDWFDLMKAADADLERIRKNQRTLGSKTDPTPPDASLSVASDTSAGDQRYWP